MPECAVCSAPASNKCARCRCVFYCSPAHQKEDWKAHKVQCPRLAQEALAAVFHPCEEELLLRITTCLAQNGYHKEVGVMVQLNKAFWNDEQIWDAYKDVPGPGGKTHLLYTILLDQMPRMIWLCKRGARINYGMAKDGYTNLMAACEAGNLRMVRALCERGADVNAAKTDAEGTTPLFWASQNCASLELIRELCARGADVNTFRRDDGMSALMWAIKRGRLEVVRELCRKGANVNACMNTGMNGLMWACSESNVEMVRELQGKGAVVNGARTSDGVTALMMACGRDNGLEIVRFLIKKGATVNSATTGSGTTPLIYATSAGNLAIVQLLLLNGALKSATNFQGLTAFDAVDMKEQAQGSTLTFEINSLRIKHRAALKELLKL